MAGYLKEDVRVEERRRVIAVIKDYHQGLVPLIVPMTILRHYIELHDIPYVNQQVYLNPHPRELMLRNHQLSTTSAELRFGRHQLVVGSKDCG